MKTSRTCGSPKTTLEQCKAPEEPPKGRQDPEQTVPGPPEQDKMGTSLARVLQAAASVHAQLQDLSSLVRTAKLRAGQLGDALRHLHRGSEALQMRVQKMQESLSGQGQSKEEEEEEEKVKKQEQEEEKGKEEEKEKKEEEKEEKEEEKEDQKENDDQEDQEEEKLQASQASMGPQRPQCQAKELAATQTTVAPPSPDGALHVIIPIQEQHRSEQWELRLAGRPQPLPGPRRAWSLGSLTGHILQLPQLLKAVAHTVTDDMFALPSLANDELVEVMVLP